MENSDYKTKNSEEVDLTQIFRWIGRGFSRAGDNFIYVLASIRNIFFLNLRYFGIVLALGLIMGVLYAKLLTKEYYKTSMVLSCSYLNNQIVQNTIVKLNSLRSDPSGNALAEELGIEPAIAKNVRSFEVEAFVSEDEVIETEVLKEQLNNVAADKKNIVDKIISKLSIENKDAYKITVLVYETQTLKKLESGLVQYFKNNEYVKRRIEINNRMRLDRKLKLERESGKLDSLKSLILQNQTSNAKNDKGSNNVFLNEENQLNTLDVFKEDLRINQEILDIDHDLYVHPEFELVDGFAFAHQLESPSLWKILFNSFWISLILGYLLFAAREFDRLLANYPTRV